MTSNILSTQTFLQLLKQGKQQISNGNIEEGIETFAPLFEHDPDELPAESQLAMAQALLHRGQAMNDLDRHSEATRTYDYLLRCFHTSTELPFQLLVAEALDSKANLYSENGQLAEEIATRQKQIALFGDEDHLKLQQFVADALMQQAYVLEELGRTEEAKECYNKIIQRYEETTKPGFRELLEKAIELKKELGRS